jgi:hypothetical protein
MQARESMVESQTTEDSRSTMTVALPLGLTKTPVSSKIRRFTLTGRENGRKISVSLNLI